MYTVAVATGTRAEYGLLRPVIEKMKQSGQIHPRLLVTGAHLSAAFGNTISEIEADGYEIAARLDILSQPVPAGRAGTAQRTALALRLFLGWLEQPANRPDVLLLLGDRYEMLAAGQAAALLDIPLIHISGGDVTAGADDDWFRHCLTKMAKLHFPSCETYRQRILRMGEQPERVFNVGGLGDENIRTLHLLTKKTLGGSLGLTLPDQYALVTLHPETMSALSPRRQATILLEALERVKIDGQPLYYLFTGANADAGGDEINRQLQAYCNKHSHAGFVTSLGVLRYLSAMKHARLVIGNSSSGVVETPSLKVPTVDIGNRQSGRVRPDNVIHCAMDSDAIVKAVSLALSTDFARQAATADSPYDGGDTSGKMVELLIEFLQKGVLAAPKVFYDGGIDE